MGLVYLWQSRPMPVVVVAEQPTNAAPAFPPSTPDAPPEVPVANTAPALADLTRRLDALEVQLRDIQSANSGPVEITELAELQQQQRTRASERGAAMFAEAGPVSNTDLSRAVTQSLEATLAPGQFASSECRGSVCRIDISHGESAPDTEQWVEGLAAEQGIARYTVYRIPGESHTRVYVRLE